MLLDHHSLYYLYDAHVKYFQIYVLITLLRLDGYIVGVWGDVARWKEIIDYLLEDYVESGCAILE